VWILCAFTFEGSVALAQDAKAFLHVATAGNTSGGSTTIEDVFVNARPDLILIVTPNWNPGGAGSGVYNNSPIAVLYNERTTRWAIFNLDMRVPISVGAAFNIKAYRPGTRLPALVHRATASNTSGNYTFLEPPLSPVSNALLVTPNWNPGGGMGVSNNHPVGVFFELPGSSDGRWRIANQAATDPMPVGAAFNVAAKGVSYPATVANIRGNSMYLENWQAPNDPAALLFVTPNPYPRLGPGVYNNHPLGVWYDAGAGKWAIFNQDLAAIPVGASFTVLVETDTAVTTSRIAFSSNRDGPFEVYVMGSDGTGQRRLTSPPISNAKVALSPDGTKVAFISDLSSSNQLKVINTDGTGLATLWPPGLISVLISKPSWSLNSRQLTMVAYGPDSPPAAPETPFNYGLHSINADGSGARHLSTRTTEGSPAVFSPDGSKIAFIDFYSTRNAEINVVNVDGSGRLNLTRSTSVSEDQPAWSPDGRFIVFSAYRASRHTEVYVMNSDGTGVRQLTNSPRVSSFLPVFSPDGRKIAFISFVDDGRSPPTTTAELYVMNSDGTGAVRLATDVVVNIALTGPNTGLPSFSPDGQKIAFVSNRDGNHEIYVVNIDGTGLTNLTRNPAADEEPSWGR
jgi:Tol biopolymer transport system component